MRRLKGRSPTKADVERSRCSREERIAPTHLVEAHGASNCRCTDSLKNSLPSRSIIIMHWGVPASTWNDPGKPLHCFCRPRRVGLPSGWALMQFAPSVDDRTLRRRPCHPCLARRCYCRPLATTAARAGSAHSATAAGTPPDASCHPCCCRPPRCRRWLDPRPHRCRRCWSRRHGRCRWTIPPPPPEMPSPGRSKGSAPWQPPSAANAIQPTIPSATTRFIGIPVG